MDGWMDGWMSGSEQIQYSVAYSMLLHPTYPSSTAIRLANAPPKEWPVQYTVQSTLPASLCRTMSTTYCRTDLWDWEEEISKRKLAHARFVYNRGVGSIACASSLEKYRERIVLCVHLYHLTLH